jgi:predicted PurR-regulated permease PerM
MKKYHDYGIAGCINGVGRDNESLVGRGMISLGKNFWLIFGVVLVTGLVYLLEPILSPFLVGIILAYLGDPLVDRLEKAGLGRTPGAILVFSGFAVLLIGLLLILIPILFRETARFVQSIPDMLRWLQQMLSPVLISSIGIDPFDFQVDSLKSQLAAHWQQTGSFVSQILARMTLSGVALLGALINLALIPVVAFYLMRDWDLVVAKIQSLVPRKAVGTVNKLALECDEVLAAFLRGQLLVMAILGSIYALGLSMIGLDLAILIGLIAGAASIVPYLGFAIGVIAALIAAFYQFQDWLHPGYVMLVFLSGQVLEGTVLTPWLVGDKIGLHPVAVIFAILAGGQLFGFIGVLLALPLAAVLMVLLRYLLQHYLDSDYYARSGSELLMADSSIDSSTDSSTDSPADSLAEASPAATGGSIADEQPL